MKKLEFMERLESLLADLPEAERNEALQYYNDYLEDAGEENEEAVIEGLGSPEKVAATIKGSAQESGEFTETGYQDGTAINENEIANRGAFEGETRQQEEAKPKKKMSGSTLALIIILCILFSPLIIAIAGAAFGIIVAIFSALFAIIVGGIALVGGILIGAIGLLGGGIASFAGASPLLGGTLVGLGLLLAGLFLLFLWLVVAMIKVVVPGAVNIVKGIWKSLFGKRGRA